MAPGPEVGRDRGARLDRAQLPRLRDLGPDPEVEARRHGQHARRQPVPGGQPADDPRARHRRPLGPVRGPRRGGVEELPRGGRRAARRRRPSCTPVPLRHDHADPRRRRRRSASSRSRATRSPTIPGQAGEQDQLRLRVRRREARRSGRSRSFLGINIDQVAIIDFDGFRKFIDAIGGVTVEPARPKVCSSVSGGAFNLQARRRASTPRRLPGDHPGPHPREHLRHRAQFTGTDIERAQFQQLILDGIKGRLTDPLRLPVQLHQGPVHRLERAEGDGLEHGRADDAAARHRRGDRRRRRHRRPEAVRRPPPPAT